MTARISLVVPGLCGPLPHLETIGTAADDLVELLKRSRQSSKAANEYAQQMMQLFGMDTDKPVAEAALSLLGHGIDAAKDCVLHADPVHLLADMDHAILNDSQVLDIRPDEAEQLIEEINAHFADDGFQLIHADTNNWFIRLDACDMSTTPVYKAVGRNINHLLPKGADADRWKRIMNEAQMLFHMSSVNERREQRGVMPINSLWLWGEGVLPERSSSTLSRIFADDDFASGLAKLNDVECTLLAEPSEVMGNLENQQHTIVVLKQMFGPCNYGDVALWTSALNIVQQWIVPLVNKARATGVDTWLYPCNRKAYHINSGFNFRFWSKQKLENYVDVYQS